jgi:hypothetical protein
MTATIRELLVDGLVAKDAHSIGGAVMDAISNDRVRVTIHPLGYFHFLLDARDGLSLRLHYWPAHERPSPTAVTPYHDHVWDLESRVLHGEIVNSFVETEPDPSGPFMVATIEQVAGVDSVVPTSERVKIASVETTTYESGARYTIKPRRFHATDVAQTHSAITLVRAEVVVPGGPRTLVSVGYEGQAPARVAVSSDAADRLSAEIRALLAS